MTKLKCPKCGKLIKNEVGIESKCIQTYDFELDQHNDLEIGDTLCYFCKNCGSTLPRRLWKSIEKLIEERQKQIKIGLCENPDCSKAKKKLKLYPVEMKEEFDSEGKTFWWCEECIKRDKDILNFNPLK